VSVFAPDVPPIPKPDPAELLARFLPSALRRTPPVAKLWRWPQLVFRGVLTAGFWPCRVLQVRLRQTLVMHAQQCDLSVRLLRVHLPADDVEPAADAARRTNVSFVPLNASCVAMLAAMGLFFYWMSTHGFTPEAARRWWLHAPAPGDAIAWASVALLSAAYLLLIVQINQQLVALQQFALAFNAGCGERMGEIDPPPLVWGLRPLYVGVGVVLAYLGLIWALPMMLTWAAFGSFANDAARGLRVQLADRLASLGGEAVIPTGDLCPNPQCRNGLPHDAVFCPRCGVALGPKSIA
jgi:hypothetical protein